jgi:hypothetical protein
MKILCNGCSFTYGDGFLESERESKIWPTLLGKKLQADVTNIAANGSSNLEIFLRTLRELDKNNYDLVIVQWSALRRYWFRPGINQLYTVAGTPEEVSVKDWFKDWSTKDMYINSLDQKKFHNTLFMLTGDYHSSRDIATYCQTLIKIQQPGQKIIFVNGLLPWTQELIFPPTEPFDMANHFSTFTKQMLEFNDFDDDHIRKHYYKLHQEIVASLPNWVNLDDPWRCNLVDTATLGHHPGPESHRWVSDKIQKYLFDLK